MKKIYFSLCALLMCSLSFAQLTLNTIDNLELCDENNDGYATFDLSIANANALGNYAPDQYSVAYFETEDAATAGTPALPFTYTNVTPGQQYIYAKVWQTTNPDNYGIAGFYIIVHPTPTSTTAVTYTICNEALPNDGTAAFDLTSKISEILGGPTSGYTVNFYTSLADQMNSYYIQMPEAYYNTSNPQTILALVQNDATGCDVFVPITLRVNPLPEQPALITLYACGGTYDLTTAIENESYTTTFYPTVADAHAETNPIIAPQSYMGTTPIYARVTLQGPAPGDPACYQLSEIQLVSGMSLTNTDVIADGTTITILATAVPDVLYQIDNLSPQSANVFYNIAYGVHNIKVTDGCGNILNISYLLLPSPPAPDPAQNVSEGDTLADIILYGADIQWYADAAGTIPLSPDTVLVAGITYYATQTMDGYESPTYAYMVSGFAGIDTLNKNTVTAYPNPVNDVLTVSAAAEIKSVEVYNVLGRLSLTQQVSGTSAAINMQGLQSGVYMVKLIGENGAQMLKVIKE